MPLFYQNIFLLLGTIIGAGIFSLPSALKDAGIFLFFFFLLVISYFLAKINLYYREIVESSHERHQLAGYVKEILGYKMSVLASVLLIFSTFGTLLAYLIIAGDFISEITPIGPEPASLLFFAAASFILLFAGKGIETLDLLFTIIKVILLIIITFLSVDFLIFHKNAFPLIGASPIIAYGSILFAISGFSIVPELKKHISMKGAINTAQVVVLVIYSIFSLSMVGLVNNEGIFIITDPFAKIIFNLAGIFGVFTPYLMLSWVCYDLFNKDLGFDKKESLILVVIVPILLFLIGIHSFSSVISVTGGVFFGGIAIIIAHMYRKKFPEREQVLPFLIQLVFVAGIVAEVIAFLK